MSASGAVPAPRVAAVNEKHWLLIYNLMLIQVIKLFSTQSQADLVEGREGRSP